MHPIIKDTALSALFLLITYLGFIHNIGVLQVFVAFMYTIGFIITVFALILLYSNFPEAITFKNNLKDGYKLHNIIISLYLIPITCWILYVSNSYNFLTVYIVLVILRSIIRYKVNYIVKNR